MSRIEPRPPAPVPLAERPRNAPKRGRERRKPDEPNDEDKKRKGKKDPDEHAERDEDEPGERVDVYL